MLQYTSLGRPLDPRHYATNLAILVFTLLGGVIAGVVHLLNNDSLADAVVAGLAVGAAVFVAWAISREIDPDNQFSAFLSSVIALGAALFLAPLQLLVLGGAMVLCRVVNRTVGPPATFFDTVTVLVLTIIIIFTGQWMFGIVATVAFSLDALLNTPVRRHWIAAGLSLVAMFAYLVVNDAGTAGELTLPYLLVVAAITVLFIIVMLMNRNVRSKADMLDVLLNVRRVQAAMLVALLAALVMLWHGDTGIEMMSPMWASLLGVALYRIMNLQTSDQVSIVNSRDHVIS